MRRRLDKTKLDVLISSPLWINKLKQDCLDGKVFLAIRDNRVDFYHKGGKLFSFDGKAFKTHIKYAAVISTKETDYLTENELENHKLATKFEPNYKRIKENCSNYSGVEAAGISSLYHQYSYFSNSNVVVLDIEVSFASDDEKRYQDRIDVVLLNKTTKELRFVEAKHFSNKDIWSTTRPNVINQMEKYMAQIQAKKDNIISEYVKYMRVLNSIFNGSVLLPQPQHLDEDVTLLIFGFDADQRGGRLKKLVTKNDAYYGINNYCVGNIEDVKSENLWSEAKVL